MILWGGAGGGGVEVPVIISIQCLNTWYSSAGYGVFHCGKRVSEGYGVFRRWIWGFHMGYAVNWA